MKILIITLTILLLASAPARSDNAVVDIDKNGNLWDLTNYNSTYWTGADINSSNKGQLINANTTTEQAWLNALLGYDYTFVHWTARKEFSTDPKFLTNYNPGFAWDYAVIKYGEFWTAYENTGNDQLLTTGTLNRGISHVTFFGGTESVSTPEPASLMLLGLGLIGVGTAARRRRRLRKG